MSHTVGILTCKSLEDIIEAGGSGWWKIDPAKVKAAGKVLIMHNAHDKRAPGDPSLHGKPLILATVADVHRDEDGRYLIQFSEFAEVTSEGFSWPGYRNPVTYLNDDEVMRHLQVGEWQEMPSVPFAQAQNVRQAWDAQHQPSAKQSMPAQRSFGQILEHHRAQIASELGVDFDAVRITVEAG